MTNRPLPVQRFVRPVLFALAPAAVALLLVVTSAPADARRKHDGPCAELRGGAFGLCRAYCEAKECHLQDSQGRSCKRLRRKFAKRTGTTLFPCDEEPAFCGDDVVDPELGEECDGAADAACPGLCVPPRSTPTAGRRHHRHSDSDSNSDHDSDSDSNRDHGGGADGSGGSCTCDVAAVPAPSLVGLDADKPMILPAAVQAAYNDDTMFFHISWEGDRGDTHDYVHFTNGAWQREGFPRREAQSTIDNDPARGPTNRTSTIYESRVTFMVDDPIGPNSVPDFDRVGCFATCHDISRAMPQWDPSTDLTKFLNEDTPGPVDLWHHRLARANPIGASDDQHVTRIPPGGEAGGRFGDSGGSPWQVNDIVDGVPTYAFDPATTRGAFAFPFEDLFASPLRFFRRGDAPELGAGPVSVGIDFADALAMGYVPQEGDTIPRRRLRQPIGSRGDITGLGSTYTPSPGDPLFGRIDSNTQRLLDTGNPDDTALVEGGVYNVAFAVHTGMVTVRDHYVGFPMTLSLAGGPADIEAVRMQGSGRDSLPDFSDTGQFPSTDVNLFLPGIASLEFLRGENTGLVYIDPVTDAPVSQVHAGAFALMPGGLGCRDCHTAAVGDPYAPQRPGGFDAGPMEVLAGRRGGVNTPTPIPPSAASSARVAMNMAVASPAATDPEEENACGIGFELVLVMPALLWLHRRRRHLLA